MGTAPGLCLARCPQHGARRQAAGRCSPRMLFELTHLTRVHFQASRVVASVPSPHNIGPTDPGWPQRPHFAPRVPLLHSDPPVQGRRHFLLSFVGPEDCLFLIRTFSSGHPVSPLPNSFRPGLASFVIAPPPLPPFRRCPSAGPPTWRTPNPAGHAPQLGGAAGRAHPPSAREERLGGAGGACPPRTWR